jgi:hypothetical protein
MSNRDFYIAKVPQEATPLNHYEHGLFTPNPGVEQREVIKAFADESQLQPADIRGYNKEYLDEVLAHGKMDDIQRANLTYTAKQYEVNKTFDWGGAPTTDINAMTSGAVLVTEDLDLVPNDLTLGGAINAFKFLDAIPAKQINNARFHQWIDKTDIGGVEGDTVTNEYGFAVEAQPNYKRHYVAISYYAAAYSELESYTKQNNYLSQLVNLRADTQLRMKRDKALQLWQSNIGTPNVTDGFQGQIERLTNVEGAFPGEFIADFADTSLYSGLDGAGFSDPEDVERWGRRQGEVFNRPENAGGYNLTDIYVPTDIYKDYNEMRNYTAYQILNNSAQQYVTGALMNGFSNRYGNPTGNVTMVKTDRWMQEARRLLTAQTRSQLSIAHASVPAPVSVVAATSNNVNSRFTPTWYGTYVYGAEYIDVNGRPSAVTVIAAAVTVGAGNNTVTLTLTPPVGSVGGAFKIYRSKRNNPALGLAGINDMRFMVKVQRAVTPTTVVVDMNFDLPGSLRGFAFDENVPGWNGQQLYTFGYSEILLPRSMSALLLAPTGMVGSFGHWKKSYKSMAMFKNYVSRSFNWTPL